MWPIVIVLAASVWAGWALWARSRDVDPRARARHSAYLLAAASVIVGGAAGIAGERFPLDSGNTRRIATLCFAIAIGWYSRATLGYTGVQPPQRR